MRIETLIYAYLAICSGMIVFNCLCIFAFRRQDKRLLRHSARLEEAVTAQLARVRTGGRVERAHQELLRRKLGRMGELVTFDDLLERLLEQEPDTVWSYLAQIRPVFAYLAVDNRYKDAMELACFACAVRKYRMLEGAPMPALLARMMELLDEPSIYCWENALQAICSLGDCGSVLRAVNRVDSSVRFHHARMLTDGLLAFRGDRQELCRVLWRAFGSFSAPMRLVVLDYIRLAGGELRPELARLLADSHQADELRFSCIRYFGEYPYQPVFPMLIEFAAGVQHQRWEYAALAAETLAAYPGERTVEVLKGALGNVNWYVRASAAQSLETFQSAYPELGDVMSGGGAYAREILQYRMDFTSAGGKRKEG